MVDLLEKLKKEITGKFLNANLYYSFKNKKKMI